MTVTPLNDCVCVLGSDVFVIAKKSEFVAQISHPCLVTMGCHAHPGHWEAFVQAFLIYVAEFDHNLSCGSVSLEIPTLKIALESSDSGQQCRLKPVYSGHITAVVAAAKNVEEITAAK